MPRTCWRDYVWEAGIFIENDIYFKFAILMPPLRQRVGEPKAFGVTRRGYSC